MQVVFPHAEGFQVAQGLFLAAWKVWFKRFGAEIDWRSAVMPVMGQGLSLAALVELPERLNLDLMCRLLVPGTWRDRSQFDSELVQINPHLIRPQAGGFRLSGDALHYWDLLPFVSQDLFLNQAEALIQADIETPTDACVILDDAGIVVIGEDTYPPYVPEATDPDLAFVEALVAWIQDSPFQPMYRRQPVGESLSGWDERLSAFFWPKPRVGYAQNELNLQPIRFRAEPLALKVEQGLDWNESEQGIAVKVARETFALAGTPQAGIRVERVRQVFETALGGQPSDAPLNGGWAKLAEVATAHREAEGQSLVAWDGRISTAVISRLDFLLVEAGLTEVGSRFADLGTIPGWGGTRPRPLSLVWPDGYRQWPALFAASRLLIQIRDLLNGRTDGGGRFCYPRMPLPDGGRGSWTLDGVQRVLFCDGY